MNNAKEEIDEIYKDLTNFKQIPYASDYLISEYGIVYTKKTKKYRKPMFHKSTNRYCINLNIEPRQQQIKNLLYITFIDPNFDVEELFVESKYCIHIKNTREDQPFINFTIEDLEFISKSDLLKQQARFNKIINKYDLGKNFIKSYNNIEEAKTDLNVKDGKYITLCASKSPKQPKYKNFIFRYDNNDEIKYPNLADEEETKISVEEFNKNKEEEIWKEINGDIKYSETMIYEISNFGNVKSIRKVKNGNKIQLLSQQIIGGYKYCDLTVNNNKSLKMRINVLVAKYFLTIPDRLLHLPKNKIVVDHIDHNKLNNHYTNLQYVTYNENNSSEYRN